MTPPSPSSAKISRLGDYKAWAQMASTLGVENSKFCEACGYAPTSWFHWRKSGQVPMPALLAGECLVRRNNQQVRSAPALFSAELIGGTLRLSPLLFDEFISGGKTLRILREK